MNENLHSIKAMNFFLARVHSIFGWEYNQTLIYLNNDSSETHINVPRRIHTHQFLNWILFAASLLYEFNKVLT